MPIHYRGCSRGFSLRQRKPEVSPFAEAVFGVPKGKTIRTALSPSLIKEDMLKMGSNTNIINDLCFQRVVRKAFDVFKVDQVSPYHLNDIFDMDLECRKSSPGIPWQPAFRTRGEVMDDTSARNSILLFWRELKRGKDVHPPDCKVLYRAHLNKDGLTPKIRAVYGYGTTITLIEACFAIPLIEAYKNAKTPIAYGYDMAVGGAYKLRRRISSGRFFSCFDFSGFDKTVSAQLIDIAFDILLSCLDCRYYQNFGTPSHDEQRRVFDFIRNYFINTPLRMNNGERWIKTCGVPSGSYFTQLVDSIVNWIVLAYAVEKSYGFVPDILVFGDDSIIVSDIEIDKFEIARNVEDIGMSMNLQKCVTTSYIDEVEFLGFKIDNGFPVRSLDRWMEAVYHPEWPDEEWDDFASRLLGLFYANCGVNSTFSHICRTVIGMRSFTVNLSRDTQRLIRMLGVQMRDLRVDLPSDETLLTRLII